MEPVRLVLRPVVREDVDEIMPFERYWPTMHTMGRLIIDKLARFYDHLVLLPGVVIDLKRPWCSHASLVDVNNERERVC